MPAINWKHFSLSAAACFILAGIVVMVTWRTPRITSIDKVEFVNITDSFINLKITCNVNNTNFYSIKGKNVQLRFSESDKQLGDGNIETFSFGRNGQSTLTGTLRINFKQILRSYDIIKADTVAPVVSITGSFMPLFFISKVDIKEKVSKRDVFRFLFNALRDNAITAGNELIHHHGSPESIILL
jgi:LEA14-like dessication related protein